MLWDRVDSLFSYVNTATGQIFCALLDQYKAVHKHELINAQMDMFHHLHNIPPDMKYLDKKESAEQFAEQYYNEKFGGNNGTK